MNRIIVSLAISSVLTLSACVDDGDKGDSGVNGLTSLISHKNLPLGNDECFFGGLKIESGVDKNTDNVLSTDEITDTTLDCHATVVNSTGSRLPYSIIRSDIDNAAIPGSKLEIRNGGYGSDMVAHPTKSTQFYALTDRGANAKFTGDFGKGKKFPTPDYAPRIGLFELQANGDVKKIKDIILKRPDGELITGLPNSAALGGTGETPYDSEGNVLLEDMTQPFNAITNPIKLDNYGLDGEGLVALSDGTFWVSDEYGPHIVHFDAEGKEIGRINAFSEDERTTFLLPAEFANRRPNRGMEGLTVTPDEKMLVGIMQSTIYNPSKAVKNNNLVRIVTINLADGKIGQYLYKQEINQNSQSGIVALSNTEFVVIERDGKFYNYDSTAMKHLYKIDISEATNLESIKISGNILQNESLGLTIEGETLEQISMNINGWATIENVGINTVSKILIADLIAEVSYPHDKLEGMWLINKNTLGILNDDDFATWATNGELEQKYLDPANNIIDGNTLYILENIDLSIK